MNSSSWLNIDRVPTTRRQGWLDRFRYNAEEPRDTSKSNGKPILRSNDYGTGAFETGFDLDKVSGDPGRSLMVCGVCLCLPRYPIELSKCGHIYCYICAMRTLNFQSPISPAFGAPCPNCKQTFVSSNIVEFKRDSQALQNIYNGYDIRCIYGCGYICAPTAMLEHENWVCTQRPVHCINEHCDAVLSDRLLESHLEVCTKRMIYCATCTLPRKLDGRGHNCERTSRDTIRGIISKFFIDTLILFFLKILFLVLVVFFS